jgi:hypothetical protein
LIKRHTRRKFTRYGHRVEKAYLEKYGSQIAFITEGLHKEYKYHATLNNVLNGSRPGYELREQIADLLGVKD